jgi:hypothetical protein
MPFRGIPVVTQQTCACCRSTGPREAQENTDESGGSQFVAAAKIAVESAISTTEATWKTVKWRIGARASPAAPSRVRP